LPLLLPLLLLPLLLLLLPLLLLLLPLLLLLQWLQFCRVNPSGLMWPNDVQEALAEIMALAATWA
jgi:hypothetical protein